MNRQEGSTAKARASSLEPARRGRRPQISAEDILEAATRRIGTEWTVAAVAADLGVTDAAIYRYFPSRKAILVEVGNRRIAQLAVPQYGGDWRAFLDELAWSWYDLYLEFPAFLDLGTWAGLSSADSQDYWDRVLREVLAAGFSEVDTATVVSLLQAISREAALVAHAEAKAASTPVLVDPDAGPRRAQVFTALGRYTAREAFERGLKVVLDGVEQLLSSGRRSPRRAAKRT